MKIYIEMEVHTMANMNCAAGDYTDCEDIAQLADALIETAEEQACISTRINPESLQAFWKEVRRAKAEEEELCL